jgi:prepilin-type N-terminal cleavage/methylation domain-containing protein
MMTKGFTLIEMMVVVGLVTLLIVLMGIPLLDSVPTYSLRNAIQQVSSDLRYAAHRAIAEHNNFYAQFDTVANIYGIVDDNDNSGTFTTGDTQTPKLLPRGVRLAAVNFTATPLTFRPDGSASASGSVTLRNTKGTTNQVRIAFGGLISVQ